MSTKNRDKSHAKQIESTLQTTKANSLMYSMNNNVDIWQQQIYKSTYLMYLYSAFKKAIWWAIRLGMFIKVRETRNRIIIQVLCLIYNLSEKSHKTRW